MNIPDTIYLQIEDEDGPLDPSDRTMCLDRVFDSDVVYVSAGVADKAFATWEEAIQELRASLSSAIAIPIETRLEKEADEATG